MRVDVHQHLWTEPFVQALADRGALPLVRRAHGLTTLHLAGERPYVIDADSESPARRAALVAGDGLDRALVAISSPLGVEALPRADALSLIDSYAEGALVLPREFAAWGPLALQHPDPADVDVLLSRGFVGASLPAGALGRPNSVHQLAAVLRRLEDRDAPLFVHPGPGLGSGPVDRALSSSSEPPWWRALTGYVAQMQAAWLSFVTCGRARFPRLRVVFAMLAGGAPLLSERLEARGGPQVDVRDQRLWYDSSSYGPVAVQAMARRVGLAQLLYGSDRPVVEPRPSDQDPLLQANGAWLLNPPQKLAESS